MTEKPLYSKDDGVYCVMGRLKSIHPIIIKTHYCVFTLVIRNGRGEVEGGAN
jgi:hypothetical protein